MFLSEVHGHDDMHKIVVTDRVNDPRGIAGVGFQRHAGGADHIQHFAQEFYIESDEQAAAFNGSFHGDIAFAGFFGLGIDLHLSQVSFAGFDVEADDVVAFAGDDLSLFASLEKCRGGEGGAGFEVLGNNGADNPGNCHQ